MTARSATVRAVCRWAAQTTAVLLTGVASTAWAVLGEPVESIQADQIRLQGRRTQHAVWPAQVHDIQLTDGSRVRQYVNASGVVFAVSWHSRLKPNLSELLGRHYQAYAAVQRPVPSLMAARQASLSRANDLVVHASGRSAAHAGWAYVPSLTPGGFDVAALR